MTSNRKTAIYLWDDECGESTPFTPEDVNARLEAANDRADQEDAGDEARNKELDALFAGEEALAEKFYNMLQESISEMHRINDRVAELTLLDVSQYA